MTAPSRVIFVNRVYWPSTAATAQLLTDLAEALAARGREVHVIAAGTGPDQRNSVAIHRTGGTERTPASSRRRATTGSSSGARGGWWRCWCGPATWSC